MSQNFTKPIDFYKNQIYIVNTNLKAIHNKDYSVVKTFRAARKRRSLFFANLFTTKPSVFTLVIPTERATFPLLM